MDKSCYPELKVWLIQLLPGGVCALTGLGLYCFAETDSNYFYTHSIWHLLMASAVLLLLPREETLSCGSVRAWFRHFRVRPLRRNELADEAASTGDNHSVLIESGTPDTVSTGGS